MQFRQNCVLKFFVFSFIINIEDSVAGNVIYVFSPFDKSSVAGDLFFFDK